MPVLPMALSLVMGYAIHTQFSRIWFSVLQSALCFSLRLYFSNDICRAPNSWRTMHEREARIHGWMTLTKILVPTCLYCLNCTKFDQLILRKIIKIVAARCPILRLNSAGLRPRPRWGSLQRSPRPPIWIWGPTSSSKIIGLLRKQLPSPPVHVR